MFNNLTFIRDKKSTFLKTSILLRKVYMLLSSIVFFSAFTAFISIIFDFGHVNIFFSILVSMGFLFLINIFKNSFLGLFFAFFFTGFMGCVLGPIINSVLRIQNGSEIIFFSLILTGLMFFALSLYVLISRRNLDGLRDFLFLGTLFVFVFFFASFFINISAIIISCLIIILSCGMILSEVSYIIHVREANYILVSISLYLSIYNLLISFLSLFSSFFSDD